jgi:Sensors of blue-light using FAD
VPGGKRPGPTGGERGNPTARAGQICHVWRPTAKAPYRLASLVVERDVYQVIYASAAAVPFTEGALSTLLLRARANNERLGVTGLLLFHEGSFLQVLEGDQAALESLFSTISGDKRHDHIVKLLAREVADRQFAGWNMGFVSMSAIPKTLPGFSDYLRHRGEPNAATDAATRVLSAFRDGRFRNHVKL